MSNLHKLELSKLQAQQEYLEHVCDYLDHLPKGHRPGGDEMITILYMLATCYHFIRAAEPLVEKL